MNIPFNDLHRQYLGLKSQIDGAISNVIKESAFIRGEYVEKFEHDFSKMIGARFCISCANGTDSLYIAMSALGVKNGDEVIVPTQSWISTAETVTQAGGRIVFCDVDPKTRTIDPNLISQKISPRTVGIIPVHLYGQPADMDSIMGIAKKHNLWVIEDCAQAHLANYNGRKVGTIGTAGSFSFYPGKNLGAMGDAGALTTNDEGLARKMAMFARHGGLSKGEHLIEGINSRMDGLQAAILSVKLPLLPSWTDRRRELADEYSAALSFQGIRCPVIAKNTSHAWHLYVVEVERRPSFIRFLHEHGIATSINYPTALPFLPAYARFGSKPSDYPVAHHFQSRCVSLPLYPELSNDQVSYLLQSIRKYFEAEG